MLIGFKVKNFRSFKDLQHFSMIAGKVRNNENHIIEKSKHKILKFSGIFGANGSGKSNIILAMSIAQTLLEKGTSALINNQFYRGVGGDKKNDSYFEYELALNDKLYSYGFELNFYNKEIISEWLIDMTKPKEKIIFERDIKNNNINSNIIDNKYPNFSTCLSEMKNNSQELFLKEMIRRLIMANNNDSYFDDIVYVFKFLTIDTNIIRPTTHKLLTLDYIHNKEKIIKILKQLDININDIEVKEEDIKNIEAKLLPRDFQNLLNNIDVITNQNKNISCSLRINNDLYTITKNHNNYNVKSLRFIHNKTQDSFGAYEESDGTIRTLELIDILLTKNKLFLIDEIDSSLHPLLVEGLLRLFLNSKTTNQLIITTHELKTLDFDLVRRDEIWFSEKSNQGDSRIYSLEEYKDVARFDKKIDKAYLEGRFGAIANININNEN